jgi:predicted methyltransferase
MRGLLTGSALLVLVLAGCGQQQSQSEEAGKAAAAPVQTSTVDAAKLDAVLADPRREKDRLRDQFRHTRQTMAFFGLSPDMNVVEVLPGGGWYTRVLLPYVSPEGGWYGINYSVALRKKIFAQRGMTLNDEATAKYNTWPQTYLETAAINGPENGSVKGGFLFEAVPQSDYGTMDAIIFVRALHHLNRIDPVHLENAVTDSFNLLKPGGMVGIVQHRAKEDYGDQEYDTSGNKGYMKQSYIVSMFEKGGFVLEEVSEINANPKDTADYEKGVWTLPPVLGSGDDENEARYKEIGESDRMTLRFRKPS